MKKRYIKAMVGINPVWISFSEYFQTNLVEVICLDGKKRFLPLKEITLPKNNCLLNCLYSDLEAVYDPYNNKLQITDERIKISRYPAICPQKEEKKLIFFYEGKTEEEVMLTIKEKKLSIPQLILQKINWCVLRN